MLSLLRAIESNVQGSEVGQKAKGTARDRFCRFPRLGLTPILVPAKKVVLPNTGPVTLRFFNLYG